MKTVNITLPNTNWLNIEEISNVVFKNDKAYAITFRGGLDNQVCISDTTPTNSMLGHPLAANENFHYTPESGLSLFVKTGFAGTTVVLS